VVISVILTVSWLTAQETAAAHQLAIGDAAPDFTLPYATKDSVAGDDLALSSLIGRNTIVLAFYPADWSGGCTKEMCTMRDNFSELAQMNAEVLGISGDYAYSHHEWAKHLNLPVKLVSDHSHAIAKLYDSYNAATGYNKRTVYVIDKKGKIAYIDVKYSARDMESFNNLKSALSTLK
jgi:peroxiredoxin Q/BCP